MSLPLMLMLRYSAELFDEVDEVVVVDDEAFRAFLENGPLHYLIGRRPGVVDVQSIPFCALP